jgi:hypothetical protein
VIILFDLLIALFGGAYYTSKISADKSARNYNAKRFQNGTEMFNEISSDGALDTQMIISLRNPETRWNLLNSICSELHEVFGNGWEDKYNSTANFVESKYYMQEFDDSRGNPWWVAHSILISKAGRVPILLRRHELHGSSEMIDIQIKTFRIIEREIKKVHPRYGIVITQTKNSGFGCGWINWNFDV